MSTPSPILLPSTRGSARFEDLFDAWIFAAHEAAQALRAWCSASLTDRGMAHIVYRAALDREESAADALMVASVRRRR